MRKQIESLPCIVTLSDSEYQQYLLKLAQLTDAKKDCLSLIAQKKAAYVHERRDIKDTIKRIDESVYKTSETIQQRAELRLTGCRIVYDFDANKKSWYRLDGVEPLLVRQSTIPDDELQEEVLLEPEPSITGTCPECGGVTINTTCTNCQQRGI